jgi:hypothetical protein
LSNKFNHFEAEYFNNALILLNDWIQNQKFLGWDPFDALNSPIIRKLTFSNRRLGQAWVQLFKHSPVNLRPTFGIKKDYNPKGMGLFLSTYWRKYLFSNNEKDRDYVDFFAGWLLKNASLGYHGCCWGYNFDWPNRGFFAPAGTPTIVNTAFIGLSFVDLVSQANIHKLFAFDPMAVARNACEFVLQDLNRYQPSNDEICFSYTPLDKRFVHNANLLGAWLLAEVGSYTNEKELLLIAKKAANYTIRRQRVDGSWFYGEQKLDHWIDNFHSGYVLIALKRIGECLKTRVINIGGIIFLQKNFYLSTIQKVFIQSIFIASLNQY